MATKDHFDYVVIGSGFGGSVSSLRLVEKGYRVLTVEKGRRFRDTDYPATNKNLKKWLWFPLFNCRGPMKMHFLRHVGIFSGVGVGGGSIIYANTLPLPPRNFFKAPSWKHLADWETELKPSYELARSMLGAQPQKYTTASDRVLLEVAEDLGKADQFSKPWVSVYQGEPGLTVSDPYFSGKGPERTGCIQCGRCMLGCPHGAKNSLDKNYLWLAEKLGLKLRPDTEVMAVFPLASDGYMVEMRKRTGWMRYRTQRIFTRNIVFAGGVTGTVPLLLKLRLHANQLPLLSRRLGEGVRTNNEALIGVVSVKKNVDFSQGMAITSILHTDEHSHVEPVRYNRGSNLFRALMAPHSPQGNLALRLAGVLRNLIRYRKRWWKSLFIRDFSANTIILLFMRSLEGTMSFDLSRNPLFFFRRHLVSRVIKGAAPTCFIPEASEIAQRVAQKTDGIVTNMFTETLFGTPTTAHILGGCCMGTDSSQGVIDHRHRVFGYRGLFVIDGSALSANPGVNPSLTITALAERAMSFIEAKEDLEEVPVNKEQPDPVFTRGEPPPAEPPPAEV